MPQKPTEKPQINTLGSMHPMPADDDRIRIDTRISGKLKRFHTWPITGSQTVAEHSWQVMRIYLIIVDIIDPRFIYYIQFHDIGEQSVGDVPYPIKQNNPILKEALDHMEWASMIDQLDYWNVKMNLALSREE